MTTMPQAKVAPVTDWRTTRDRNWTQTRRQASFRVARVRNALSVGEVSFEDALTMLAASRKTWEDRADRQRTGRACGWEAWAAHYEALAEIYGSGIRTLTDFLPQ